MERAIEVLNELVRVGVLDRYAIGGAIGAVFYTEPVVTYDLDVFVVLPETAGGLVSLAALYAALQERGYQPDGECVLIAGVPVQFLPAYNPLVEEALAAAWERPFGGVEARVLRPEHLLAIALQTGRAKDRQRVAQLVAEADLDRAYLTDVVARHGLQERWDQWTS